MITKFALLIISLFFFTQETNAQTFATNDAEWVFDYNSAFHYGITKLKYSKDTIIGHRNVKIYSKQVYRNAFNRDSVIAFWDPIYLHESNGVVEYSADRIDFDTIINFNAKIGQSWMIYRRFNATSLKVTILDTLRTLISNKWLFTQSINWTHYDRNGVLSSSYTDTILDQIGSRWTYIFPFDFMDRAVDGGEGGVIRCFKNNELGVVSFDNGMYQSDFIYDCDNLTYVENEKPSTYDFALSPNPARDNINISFELDKPESIRLEIIDALGVHITTLIDDGYSDGHHTEEVSISNLIEGVYYCRLFVGYNSVGVKKLIVVK